MSWLLSLVSLALKVWDYFSAKKHDDIVKDAQRNEDVAKVATGGLHEVQIAKEARDTVDDQLSNDPSSVRRSDGFDRKHSPNSH